MKDIKDFDDVRWANPSDATIEKLARQLAADKCGLTKYKDGSNLPDDLWMQCIPEAKRLWGYARAALGEGKE